MPVVVKIAIVAPVVVAAEETSTIVALVAAVGH